MSELRDCRHTQMRKQHFNEPDSKLHDALDGLSLKSSDWSRKNDELANLLNLNLELAELEVEGWTIVGLWDPNRPPNPTNTVRLWHTPINPPSTGHPRR
jgi:hypothetical protein